MASLYWAVILLAGISATELGSPTTVTEYPSLAQVENRVGILWLQQCVATVLTSYHVLSAASCYSDPTNSINTRRIRAGSSYRGRDGIVVEIYAVYNHPTFGQLDYDGDLAVVSLKTGLPLGDTIKQVAINGQGIYLPDGLTVRLAGWGTTSEGGFVGNDNLYTLDLHTVNNDKCLEIYYYAEETKIVTENMICVALRNNEGRDLDLRDAGAPLFYQNIVVAVVSYGVPRGNDSFPIVGTAVGTYSDWIIETASKQ